MTDTPKPQISSDKTNAETISKYRYLNDGSDGDAQTDVGELKTFFKSIILIFGILFVMLMPIRSHALLNTKDYNEKECLTLTTQDQTYSDAANHLLKLKEVSKWAELLKKKGSKMVLMEPTSSAEFFNQKCFWVISIHENQLSHLVLWKTFSVRIDGKEICEKDLSDDSCKPVTN